MPGRRVRPTNNVVLIGSGHPIPFSRCLLRQRAHDVRPRLRAEPRRPDAIDRLEAAVAIHGVQLYGELKLRMMFDNPDALRMFRFCGAKGLPVTVHIDYEFDTGRAIRPNWWYGGGIEPFDRAVLACPETMFFGHAPGFWAHISGDDQYERPPTPRAGGAGRQATAAVRGTPTCTPTSRPARHTPRDPRPGLRGGFPARIRGPPPLRAATISTAGCRTS